MLNTCRYALLALVLGSNIGCGLTLDYVVADEKTYQAVAPKYEKYINSDESLNEDEKEFRKDTLRSWKARIEEAKKALK